MTKTYPFVRTGSDFLKRGSNDIGIINKAATLVKIIAYLPFV